MNAKSCHETYYFLTFTDDWIRVCLFSVTPLKSIILLQKSLHRITISCHFLLHCNQTAIKWKLVISNRRDYFYIVLIHYALKFGKWPYLFSTWTYSLIILFFTLYFSKYYLHMETQLHFFILIEIPQKSNFFNE